MAVQVNCATICCLALVVLVMTIVVTPATLPSYGPKYWNYNLLSMSNETKDYEIVKIVTKDSMVNLTAHGVMGDFSYFFSHMFEIFNIKKFIHRIGDKVTSASMCLSCKFAISLLQHYVNRGATEKDIEALTYKICSVFHIETPRVCAGLSESFKREVLQVLSKVILTPTEACGLMLGNQCSKVLNPLHNWTIPLTPFPKPPVKPISPPQYNAPILRVLQLSDTHIDPYYKEGSLANCKEPLCCREASGTPKTKADAAGYWGDYRNCDTPLRTLENMLDHINKTEKIDYVIWTGDIPPHNIWNNTRKDVSYLIVEASKLMKKYLGGVPIFPALGNHESSPVNSFPIPMVSGNDSISWLYNELVKAWAPWFPSSVISTLKLGAYYSVPINPGFRIISINMNYCNNLNWWLLLNSTDPAGELMWLVNELQTAEIKGEKVHIIGHIPPGNFDCLKVWSHNYYNIINRYESTVVAQFFGHTHNDEYEVFYDDDHKYNKTRRASGIAYIGPSITTYNGLNPGYRIYTVDGNYPKSSRVVLDHETYFLNLTEANISNKPQWQFEYSARKAFNMTALLPENWDRLTQQLEADDKLFQLFYRYYMKLSDYNTKLCDDRCKTTLLCRLRRGTSFDDVC